MENLMTYPCFITRSAQKTLCYIAAMLVFLSVCRCSRGLDGSKDLAQCRMDTWTTRDGLPPREINSMAQTPDGYLWLATRAGLVRFDGVTFTVYNAQNTPGFTRGMVCAVSVDKDGTLYVGTDGDGFGTFRDGSYTRLHVGTGKPLWGQTSAFCPAGDGSMWVGGQGANPLVRVVSGRVEAVPNGPAEIYAVVEDGEGGLWFACGRYGLIHRLLNGAFAPCLDAQKQPLTGAESLCLDAQKNVWVGCDQGGVYRVRAGRVERMMPLDSQTRGKAMTLAADAQGSVWIGGQDALYRWRDCVISVFRKSDGLEQGRVSALLEDREGDLWAGTGACLSRFNNTKLTPYTPACAKGAIINAVAQTSDGTVWLGTTQGLVRCQQGQATRIPLPGMVKTSVIQSLCADQSGTLWIATDKGGLLSFQGGRLLVHYARSNLNYVACDAGGIVLKDWTSLYRLKQEKSGPPAFVRIPARQDTGFIFTFYRDSGGMLWFGCEKGLGCARDNHVEVYSAGLAADTHVLSLVQDTAGALWLGTDKGLARYTAGKFTRFTVRDGLPDDNLYQVACDDRGTLWAGGNRGIFSVKPDDLEAYAQGKYASVPTTLYEAADGIRQFPVTTGAVLKAQDGRLWFRGETDLTLVDTRNLAVNRLVPAVKIERVVLDGRTLPAGKESVEAAPGKGELEIRYTGLSLSVPEKVRFHYQLEGFDKGWIDAGTRRAAYYTNLPPGTYRFRVMACNNDGYWNSKGATLEFTLRPRFTQTLVFRAACVLAVAGAILWGAWLRLRRLRSANRRLEARIAERTAQLLEANRELHASHQSVQEANVRLLSLATTDGMTGLANHRAFQEALRDALVTAECDAQPLALLLADVDHFKQYNDAYGHPAGDEVLRIVASVLKECAGEQDTVARYGGEEFAVLLPGADTHTALEIGERIRAAIAGCVFPCRCITMSIGAATIAGEPASGETYAAKTLIQRADEALYASKRGGRNRVTLAARGTRQDCEERNQAGQDVVLSGAQQMAPLCMTADSAEKPDARSGAQRGDQTLAGLMAVLNLRDPETDGHSQRVARFALRLAQEVIRQDVAPLSPDDLRDLTLGALLHDVGKIGVPDAILHKPGALTEAEWEVMRRHPQQGAEILSAFAHLVSALPVVRSHHERWDGSGYPDGLAGRKIPLSARLFALADTLDAMSSDRPYRAALAAEDIRQEITAMAGTQFDPDLVGVFLSISPAEWERLRGGEAVEAEFQPDVSILLPKAA